MLVTFLISLSKLDVDFQIWIIPENFLGVDRKLIKLGCWQKVYENAMFTELLGKWDIDRKFMNLGCWHKLYEIWKLTNIYKPWILTESY